MTCRLAALSAPLAAPPVWQLPIKQHPQPEFHRMLGHLPVDVAVVSAGPFGQIRATVGDVLVTVRVSHIMVWGRRGAEQLTIGVYRQCERTQWTYRDDQPDRPRPPADAVEYAAIVADVARRAAARLTACSAVW